MSTKELLIRHLDDLNETQQKSLLMFLLSMTGSAVTPETLAAMLEVEDMKQHPDAYPGYSDIDSMMKDLLS